MRVDFSEPECSSNCSHHHTSGIRNTQETEPSFLFGPFGHDSTSVGPTTTPSAPAAIASVSSGPANFNSGGFGTSTPSGFGGRQGPFGPIFATPTSSVFGTAQGPASSSPFGSTQPPAFGSGLFGAPTPSRAISTEPTQSLGPNSTGFGVTSAPTPTLFGSMQAPGQASASANTTSSTSSPIRSSSPFGPVPAVTSVSSASAQSPGRSILDSLFSSPVQASASTTNRSSGSFPCPSSSPAPAVTLVSTEPTQSLVQSMFSFGSSPAPTPSLFGSVQVPVQASSASATSSPLSFRLPQDFGNTSSSSSPFGNGVAYARPDVVSFPPASEQTTSTIVFGTTPVSVPSLFGPPQETASSTPKNPFSSSFPGFGDSYLPGSSSNGFGCNQSSFWGGRSLFAPPKTSSPQLFGFNAATTTLSSSSLSTTVTDIPSGGWHFPSRECSRPAEQGSRHTRYAPTPDFDTPSIRTNGHVMISSISASDACRHKSHEELRWEDYKQGDKGGLYPAAHISPIGSRPNAVFSPSTVSPRLFASNSDLHKSHEELRWQDYIKGDKGGPFPAAHISPVISRPNAVFTPSTVTPSIFASPSIFDHPQWTTQGNMPVSGPLFLTSLSASSTTIPAAPISPSVQRPHETDVSSPSSGCTACGATSSPSASAYSNGATTPPSAATSLPGMFFSSFGSFPMMFGTPTLAAQGMAPALQAYPIMFGTTPVAQGADLPVQATTPAIQAYPVQGFILLPFAAMNLQ